MQVGVLDLAQSREDGVFAGLPAVVLGHCFPSLIRSHPLKPFADRAVIRVYMGPPGRGRD